MARYAWNAAGLLASVRLPEKKVIAFAYDPLARLLTRTVAAPPAGGGRPVEIERTRFVWDGDVPVHAIRTRPQPGGEPLVEERTYCFDDESFVPRAHADAVVEPGGERARRWVFYVNDPIGTPEELVSERGELLGALDRQAWGRTDAAPGSKATTVLRFQGQMDDAEAELFYNRFRYYDPEVGGYISPDPIGLEGGLSAFAYVSSPLGWIDPWGLTGRKKTPPEEGDIAPHKEQLSRTLRPGLESHHIVQGAWGKRNISTYNYQKAPTMLLEESKHDIITKNQNKRSTGRVCAGQGPFSSTAREELDNIANDYDRAGLPEKHKRRAIKSAYKLFNP